MVQIYLANRSRYPVIHGDKTIPPDGKPVWLAAWTGIGEREFRLPVQTRFSAMNDLYLWGRGPDGRVKDYAVRLTGDDVSTETLEGTAVKLTNDGKLYFTIDRTFEPWTSRLPDHRRLHEITIPGTHDSATHELGLSSRCQHTTIPQQLYIGVRYFDIRLDTDNPNDPRIVHASVKTSYTLSQIAAMFAAFLGGAYGLVSTNETAVVQLKVDSGPDDDFHTAKIVDIFRAAFAREPQRLYLQPIGHNGAIPTMADLRGKLVLLRRYHSDREDALAICTPIKYFATDQVYDDWRAGKFGDPNVVAWEKVFPRFDFEWPNKTESLERFRNLYGMPFVIQDNYQAVGDRLGRKWPLISAFLAEAGDQKKPDSWFLNFTSSAWYSPTYEADLINPKLLTWLKAAPPRPTGHGYGTILMDFATAELAAEWVRMNF